MSCERCLGIVGWKEWKRIVGSRAKRGWRVGIQCLLHYNEQEELVQGGGGGAMHRGQAIARRGRKGGGGGEQISMSLVRGWELACDRA